MSYTNPQYAKVLKGTMSYDKVSYLQSVIPLQASESSKTEIRNEKRKIMKNIGMGFTITSLAGAIIGGIMMRYASTNTVFMAGATIAGITGALFTPGVILWPIADLMM